MCEKSILDPIPHTQHRQICITVKPVIVPEPTPFRTRFKLGKADWLGYSTQVDQNIDEVNANQVAHQLLVNGRGSMPTKPTRPILTTVEQSEHLLVYPFTEEEYRKGKVTLKNNKAAGIDDVLGEQLKHLGHGAHRQLHTMLNTCCTKNKIPKVWRQSSIIAILKPEKDASIPKSYRPISLLCHTNKLYERLIPNRITPTDESHLIKEQAGFRPGKSCTSQLLNITQHIEDGYQKKKMKKKK